MVELMSVIGMAFLVLVVAYWLIQHQKRGRSVDSTIVRGETLLVNESEGLCYVLGATPLGGETNEYRLLRGDNFEIKREYHNDELLDMNKLLSMVSRPMFITTLALSRLGGKVDMSRLQQNLSRLQEDYDELQAEHLALKANKDAAVQERVVDVEKLLKAMPRGGGKR